MSDGTLSERMSEFARELRTADGVAKTTDHIVGAAVLLIDGCDHAGVLVSHRGKASEVVAGSSDVSHRLDELQGHLGEGPARDAVQGHQLVISADLTQDERWSTWNRLAIEEFAVRSVLCVPLFTNENVLGSLNLYSEQVDGFSSADEEETLALATHAAVAVASAKEIEGVRTGLDTRTVIGQATGMLMERYRLDPGAAFALLTRASSHQNRKLRDVAIEVVQRSARSL